VLTTDLASEKCRSPSKSREDSQGKKPSQQWKEVRFLEDVTRRKSQEFCKKGVQKWDSDPTLMVEIANASSFSGNECFLLKCSS
jgi:hypothetical protein